MGTLASELRPLAAEVAPGPRVYVDANMPCAAVHAMRRELRWDVLFVLEDAELRRAADRRHYGRALDLGRTLITLDHDFLDERRFPAERGPGVIVCAAADERWLLQLLHYIDRAIFRGPGAGARPLLGRKMQVTTAVLFNEENPPRRRRRRAPRPGRLGADPRSRG